MSNDSFGVVVGPSCCRRPWALLLLSQGVAPVLRRPSAAPRSCPRIQPARLRRRLLVSRSTATRRLLPVLGAPIPSIPPRYGPETRRRWAKTSAAEVVRSVQRSLSLRIISNVAAGVSGFPVRGTAANAHDYPSLAGLVQAPGAGTLSWRSCRACSVASERTGPGSVVGWTADATGTSVKGVGVDSSSRRWRVSVASSASRRSSVA